MSWRDGARDGRGGDDTERERSNRTWILTSCKPHKGGGRGMETDGGRGRETLVLLFADV